MPRTEPCVCSRARAERVAEAWPGLRFSNEITALEERKERNEVEGRKEGRGAGGGGGEHLLVIVFVHSRQW